MEFCMRVLTKIAAGVLCTLAFSAQALPLMEMKAEDLMPMVSEFKKSLNLTPNQQTLWQQTETKTRNLLHERQARRERLQAAAKTGLEAPNVELRDLAGAVDAETATSAAEEKQMRAWWLEVNDALSDAQRKQVAQIITEQLLRVPDSGRSSESHPHEDSGDHNRGGHRRGGSGGAGVSLPGG
jgi:uncharacterized membrane protein